MSKKTNVQKTDFTYGPVWKNILAQAIPLTAAQLVHLLYNIVDRIYIGHMDDGSSMALTGVGLTFPIITLIMAFAALFGVGGVPLFSIARGAGDSEKSGRILGNSFSLLLISSVFLTVVCYVFKRPILFAFGASEASYSYAEQYLNIYLLGTAASMITTGMNGYINAQGFPKIGMFSIIIGAIINIALDPVFIFVLDMGVAGAALATVISQIISALWVLRFLLSRKSVIPLTVKNMTPDKKIVVMTVVNSIREVFSLPINGIISGAQPVISFNYGAKKYDRVKSGIRFNTCIATIYTMLAWLLVFIVPQVWFGIFSNDTDMSAAGIPMLHIYFFGFVFMAFQFAGQSTFQSLGDAKHAIFFSLLRKAIIVVPLTLVLPMCGFGVKGVFLAEPISNVIGGVACYTTMRITVYRRIERLAAEERSKVND